MAWLQTLSLGSRMTGSRDRHGQADAEHAKTAKQDAIHIDSRAVDLGQPGCLRLRPLLAAGEPGAAEGYQSK
jgi:hypothetical protein